MEIIYRPIGYVDSPYQTPQEVPKWSDNRQGAEMELVLDEQLIDGLFGMQAGQDLLVFFHLHESKDYRLISPLRGSGPLTGIFSTHSPHRPNPIGLTQVTVQSVDGNRIRVSGGDMIDNTPILDIKSGLIK